MIGIAGGGRVGLQLGTSSRPDTFGIMMSLMIEVGLRRAGQVDALGPVVGEQHRVALQLEVHLEQLEDHRVVLDEQHGGRRHRLHSTGATPPPRSGSPAALGPLSRRCDKRCGVRSPVGTPASCVEAFAASS